MELSSFQRCLEKITKGNGHKEHKIGWNWVLWNKTVQRESGAALKPGSRQVLSVIFLQISKFNWPSLEQTDLTLRTFLRKSKPQHNCMLYHYFQGVCLRLSYSCVLQHFVPVKSFHLIRKLFPCFKSEYLIGYGPMGSRYHGQMQITSLLLQGFSICCLFKEFQEIICCA